MEKNQIKSLMCTKFVIVKIIENILHKRALADLPNDFIIGFYVFL